MVDLGVRHNVHTMGQGRHTLVLGHGLGTDQTIWRLLAPRLAADHRVVLLDWVGCGHADPTAWQSERHGSLAGHAADLVALVGSLEAGAVTYVGHSCGAMIGVLAAIDAPHRFSALVLVNASPRYLNDPPDYFGGLTPEDVDATLSLLEVNFGGWSQASAGVAAKTPELRRELEALFGRNNEQHLREFATAVYQSDYRAELGRLALPALVLGATHDDVVPVAVNEYLHARLHESTYVCLDVAGHCPQLTNPELVEAAIRSFLKERET